MDEEDEAWFEYAGLAIEEARDRGEGTDGSGLGCVGGGLIGVGLVAVWALVQLLRLWLTGV